MPRKKRTSTAVSYDSPDGLPSQIPDVDEEGNIIDPPEPDDDEMDYDYEQCDHE